METKQLYLGEKPEQICVKIYIIHNADELELFKQAEANLNTLRGERAYLKLMTSILSRGGSDEILYDVGADFAVDYDMKLKSEFDKIWRNR
jgi:hypothetical protein